MFEEVPLAVPRHVHGLEFDRRPRLLVQDPISGFVRIYEPVELAELFVEKLVFFHRFLQTARHLVALQQLLLYLRSQLCDVLLQRRAIEISGPRE